MSTYNSDFFGLQLYKTQQEEMLKEVQRLQRIREALKTKPVRRRFRLPKITIHWN